MAKLALKISLRRNETTLVSLNFTQGCEPIFVGRSHDCVLKAPSDETSVSGKHARIFWKGSKVYIEDAGSRNGVFRAGEQVTRPVQMKDGAIFATGNCQVVVGKMEKIGANGPKRSHKLEYTNGEKSGQTVDIRIREGREDFSLGLDPSCDICLPDMLVSRRHAVFKLREDGECWIEDLGSRNGTYVNGEKLSGKERLLKDGDRIAIAYFDFRFLDSRFKHTRVHAWVKLAAIAVTVCVVIAAYVALTVTRESAEITMKKARDLAAASQFDSARELLSSALVSRDAQTFRSQIDTLASQIDLWKKTSDDWRSAQNDLAAGRFRAARHTLDRLNEGSIDSWVWNASTAAETQKEARFAGSALRLYYNGQDAISAAGHGAVLGSDQPVRDIIGPLEKFFSESDRTMLEREYLEQLTGKLREMLTELRIICDGFDKIDSDLAKISSKDPDFKAILSNFESLARDSKVSPAVREYLNHQIGPCKAFVEAQVFLEDEFSRLVNLDFDGVGRMARDLKLPDPEICTRQAKYSDARAAFLQKHAEMQKEAGTLRTMIAGLVSGGVTVDGNGEAVNMFTSASNWEKALSFDCFKRSPPSPRRHEPICVYDDMLGIEYTYESLKNLPNAYDGRSSRMVGFEPKCKMALRAFEKAELFVQYLDSDNKKYLQSGTVGKYYAQCIKVAIAREKLVSVLKAIKGNKRRSLVASFFAEYFTPRPDTTVKNKIAAQFKALSRDVAELNEAYRLETDPVKQIAIRDKMLETGIPGDPVLHPKWVQKFY